MNTWIFQANPEFYNIRAAIQELSQLHWTIKQHKDAVKPDDLVYIWESGPKGGLLAVAQVISEVSLQEDTPEEKKYWVSDIESKPVPQVTLEVLRRYAEPIEREILKQEPGLANLSLLKQPQQTNFSVSPAEANILHRLTEPCPTFRQILAKLYENKVVFQSPVRGSLYQVAGIDEGGVAIQRLSAEEDARVTFQAYESWLARLEESGGSFDARKYGGNTVADRMALLQGTDLYLDQSGDLVRRVDSLSSVAVNLGDYIQAMTVDRSGESPKLYKPVMVECVLDAIDEGELVENRIEFDGILPRFLKRMEELGQEAGETQAAHAFARLANEWFWQLSVASPEEYVDFNDITPAHVRSRVRFAAFKEVYWQALKMPACRQHIRDVLDAHWFADVRPTKRNPRVWWVNQGVTYRPARDEGFIWAPQVRKDGQAPFHWKNVSKVASGDVILHHADSAVRAISLTTSDGYEATIPEVIASENWEQLGWRADTTYYEFDPPIPMKQMLKAVPKLQRERGPVNRVGVVNQAYLFDITDLRILPVLEPYLSQLPEELIAILKRLDAMIPDTNDEQDKIVEPEPYTIEQALEGLFLEEAEFREILEQLRRKKNVILQGAPGVGKSFIAKRIAKALIGYDDNSRIEMVQFHQSFAYEDFVQGYRPCDDGGFIRSDGAFFDFCQEAAETPEIPHIFIIDEINRGNLSKIFGELLMLIEADKRGPDFALRLTYAKQEEPRFHIPENVHLIGMMNTADRSLAMVDYALRRRFTFIDLVPKFTSKKFREHLLERVEDDIVERVIARMRSLNQRIAEDRINLGPGYCIGHSFFCPPDVEDKLGSNWYREVVRFEIAPLLQEYWFDDPDKVAQQVEELLDESSH